MADQGVVQISEDGYASTRSHGAGSELLFSEDALREALIDRLCSIEWISPVPNGCTVKMPMNL